MALGQRAGSVPLFSSEASQRRISDKRQRMTRSVGRIAQDCGDASKNPEENVLCLQTQWRHAAPRADVGPWITTATSLRRDLTRASVGSRCVLETR